MTEQRRLYLVDSHAYLHRAYHALPPLKTSKGEPVGALYGFARMLLLLIKREKPDLLAVCFDSPGPTFRHKAFKEYKATRKPIDEDLKVQLALARELAAALGLAVVEAPGYEADDLMATLTRKAVSERLRVVLVSGDKDALQLIDDERVTVLNEAKGVFFDSAKVMEKFKVGPAQLVDYLALTGDSSDNVRGVPGIGAVGAAKLLNRFGSLEGLLKAARAGHPELPPKTAHVLVSAEEAVRLGRELITLDSDAPVKVDPQSCRLAQPAQESLLALLRRFEFNSLIKELIPDAGQGTARPVLVDKTYSVSASAAPQARLLDAKIFLKEAAQASELVLLASKPAQPDLLEPALNLVLGLRSGRAAIFPEEELKRYRDALARILSSADTVKVGHDLKTAAAFLREAGLGMPAPKFDTMLAAYCLNPSRGKYDLRPLLQEYAGWTEPPEKPQAGGPDLALEAAAIWALYDRLQGELRDKRVDKLYQDLELPLLDVLADMENRGFVLDEPYLRKLSSEFEERIAALKGEMDALAGVEINLNSPKQIGKLLFEDLKLPVVHKTKKGGISTDEEALRVLAPLHPLPAKIIDYRELVKLKSTYIESLLQKMDPDTRRVHTHFNQAGTATGRLSSVEPNLQNIPIRTPLGQKIRRAFTAPKGSELLSADYSQIDLRVLAHLSGDPTLCGAFERVEDVHLKTASEVFGVPPERVDKEMRRRAKAVNFGIVYGQGAHGLSTELGIPFGEAKDYIARYFARYRGVETWLKGNLESARREGCVRTLFGRVRYLPDIAARNFAVRSFNERVANNTPIQGTSADIIKLAMVNIHRKMASSKWKARLILQVHDELIFELPKAETKSFSVWVREEMETAVRLKVPIVVDIKSGFNWQDMEEKA